MELPLQITFRDISPSAAIEQHIHEHAAKLEKFFSRIMGCRVVLSAPEIQHHKKPIYHVQIDITVPGGEIVVNKERRENHENEDVYVAIRDAFHTAERQLRNHAKRQRGAVKNHEHPAPIPTVDPDEPETAAIEEAMG